MNFDASFPNSFNKSPLNPIREGILDVGKVKVNEDTGPIFDLFGGMFYTPLL